MTRVTLIPGDGIGPELTQVLKAVFHELKVPIEWDEWMVSNGVLSDDVLASIEQNRIALKGPLATPIGTGHRSLNVELRKRFDLYANIRPVLSIGNVPSRYRDVDLVIFRENTEDLYVGQEIQVSETEAHSIKVITYEKSKRIAIAAYEYAKVHHRTSVAIVMKANIMKLSDGLFLKTCREVAQMYPEIQTQEVLVDNMCMQLVMDPSRYDVILTENLYGDILSDLAAGLVGGLGFVPSGNIGESVALFEAVHGTAPDIAGQGKANPTALLLSGAMLLDYLNEHDAASRLRRAIQSLYENPETFTVDIQGPLTTQAYQTHLIDRIRDLKGEDHAL